MNLQLGWLRPLGTPGASLPEVRGIPYHQAACLRPRRATAERDEAEGLLVTPHAERCCERTHNMERALSKLRSHRSRAGPTWNMVATSTQGTFAPSLSRRRRGLFDGGVMVTYGLC